MGAYWYTKVYGEATREIIDDDYIYYCREGCAGSQQWAAVYSGNQPAELYGLKQQLNAGLSAGLCGFAVWSGDMAGYEGKPNVETYIRGVEFAAFQPLMRSKWNKNTLSVGFWERGGNSIFEILLVTGKPYRNAL